MNSVDEKLSTQQIIHLIHEKHQELEKMIYLLEARFDGAFPGGDLVKHHGDHSKLHEQQEQRKVLVKDILSRTMAGGLMALGAAFVILVIYAVRGSGWK